jgi:hypothetical protein
LSFVDQMGPSVTISNCPFSEWLPSSVPHEGVFLYMFMS